MFIQLFFLIFQNRNALLKSLYSIQSWYTFTNWNDFKPPLHDSLLLPESCPFLPTWLPVALLFPRALSADTLSAALRSVIVILLGGPLLPHELKDWSSSLIRCHIVQPWESFLFLTEPIGWIPACSPSFGVKLVLPCSSGLSPINTI